MGRNATDEPVIVAGFDGSGTESVAELSARAEEAWAAILNDDEATAEAASTFSADPEELRRLVKRVPFDLTASEQGIGIVEIAVIAVLTDVGKDLLKDAGEAALKAAGRRLWGMLKRRIEASAPTDAFGKEVSDSSLDALVGDDDRTS